MKCKAFLFLLFLVSFALPSRADQSNDSPATSTEWRDDEANINVVRELNRAYALLPFSREYEGVLDQCPFELARICSINSKIGG